MSRADNLVAVGVKLKLPRSVTNASIAQKEVDGFCLVTYNRGQCCKIQRKAIFTGYLGLVVDTGYPLEVPHPVLLVGLAGNNDTAPE